MSLLVPSGSHAQHEPRAQPSLPPSPTEEDIGGASPWIDAEDSDDHNGTQPVFGAAKRKGKAREVVLDDMESEDTMTPTVEAGYPPTTEEEDESRKIQENLKRWEQADRQRRKAARDSAASAVSNNVVSDVSRRASLLWPNRLGGGGGRNAPNGTHIHTALRQTSEDALPLSDLSGGPSSPGVSKPASPASSSRTSLPSPPSSATAFSVTRAVENPFDPPDSANLLHNFSSPTEKDADAIMQPSSPPSPMSCPPEESPFKDPVIVPKKPTLQASSSSSPPLHPLQPSQPPPRPLDLPPPKTPPPRMLTPGRTISTPPAHVAAPTRNFSEGDLERPELEYRWWTDWLCGCREGRSGDEQAGRTNPFE